MGAERVGARGPKGSGKPGISVVGAGRMGTALAMALARSGYRIDALVARRLSHARRAARLTGASPLALASTQLDRLPPSDILFITTPDDAIEKIAAELAAAFEGSVKSAGGGRAARTALHASGALSSAVLGSLRAAGFATGSMHPLLSVSDPLQGAEALRGAFFCVEGDRKASGVARSLVRALGARSFSVRTADKALYHASAVMASGHVTALFDIAAGALASCGLTEARARQVLLPLLKSTVDNLYKSDPARALTGTFARADTETVRRHLAALVAPSMRDALAAYVTLGRRSLVLAKEAGADKDALREVEKALSKV